MKIAFSINRKRGMTLIELFVVLVVIALLAAILLPGVQHASHCSLRYRCANNLKQIGLAYRVWEGDHGDRFPMSVPETNGGTMEFVTGQNAFRHYQVMSNELSTPKILFCPFDSETNRWIATNWVNFNNSNISYFVGVDAAESNATMILSGDSNITNGTSLRNSQLILTTNRASRWTGEVHQKAGYILFADGSAQWLSNCDLPKVVVKTGVLANRLQMPMLGP